MHTLLMFSLNKIDRVVVLPGILTALMTGFTNDRIIPGAFSTPTHIRVPDVIETLQAQPFCEGRSCTAYCHNESVHLILATEVSSGFSIRLHIDDLTLMQASQTIHHAVGLSADVDRECQQFEPPSSLNPNAAAFQPGRPFYCRTE